MIDQETKDNLEAKELKEGILPKEQESIYGKINYFKNIPFFFFKDIEIEIETKDTERDAIVAKSLKTGFVFTAKKQEKILWSTLQFASDNLFYALISFLIVMLSFEAWLTAHISQFGISIIFAVTFIVTEKIKKHKQKIQLLLFLAYSGAFIYNIFSGTNFDTINVAPTFLYIFGLFLGTFFSKMTILPSEDKFEFYKTNDGAFLFYVFNNKNKLGEINV